MLMLYGVNVNFFSKEVVLCSRMSAGGILTGVYIWVG